MNLSDKLLYKKDVDKKLMINAIMYLMLESSSTYNYDDKENGVSKLTVLEPIINT